MSTLIIRKLHPLTETQLTEIINVCLRTFEDEVAIISMVGGRDELRPLLFAAMVRAGALDGEIYVGGVTQRIVSLALWFRPGHSLWGSEKQRSLGYNQFMKKLSDQDKDWWTNTLKAQSDNFWKTHLPVPNNKLWFFNILATDPAHQQNGYTSALMDYVVTNEMAFSVYAALATTSP